MFFKLEDSLKRYLTRTKRGELSKVQTVFEFKGKKRTISWFVNNLNSIESSLDDGFDKSQQLLLATKQAALTQTYAALAHEFNQPLNIMRLAAQNSMLSLEKGDIKKTKEKLNLIIAQINRTADLVESVRSLKKTAPKKKIIAEQATQQVVNAWQELMEDAGIALVLRVEPMKGAKILTPPSAFELVLANLLANAKDATPKGGKVTVTLKNSKPDNIAITIKDEGEGIKDTKHLFEPFYTTKPNGNGLGLAMVYSAVSQMGGDVWFNKAKSNQKGALVKVVLPKAK